MIVVIVCNYAGEALLSRELRALIVAAYRNRNRDRFFGFWFEPTPTFYFTAETVTENSRFYLK